MDPPTLTSVNRTTRRTWTEARKSERRSSVVTKMQAKAGQMFLYSSPMMI